MTVAVAAAGEQKVSKQALATMRAAKRAMASMANGLGTGL
jgi:hypothetical protein